VEGFTVYIKGEKILISHNMDSPVTLSDYPITIQTFPKQLPPKTTAKNLRVKAMISMD
jgi:hypothetical protein